ncbi:MAG: acetate--CoA ligase [Proteobacteria bacterium]|nr:acetate--CoA ligase [Pseudomonadota bacterium]
MTDISVFQVPLSRASAAKIDATKYASLYAASIDDPAKFWAEMGKRLDWMKPYTKVKNTRFAPDISIKWYEDGILNVAHNCIDRHLPARANQTAIIWEGDDPKDSRKISFAELKDEVSRLANLLKSRGVKKGDVVTIYMPMVPEAAFAMLACARIGAIHSVVFGGFSSESLRDRIEDGKSKCLITADEGVRGGKTIPLKKNVDGALATLALDTVIVLRRTGNPVSMQDGRDIWWHDHVSKQSADCPCEPMGAEDPLFILYTSGSTGKPKGVLHTTGGYLVYASITHEYVFDVRDGDVYWCTADVGWVTGHSYIVYGPLANATTTLMFEGVPQYPDWGRFWDVVDKHQVNVFYTAPTAIRALLKEGDAFVKRASRKSLRVLGSVGEPINSEAWLWYYNVVGDARCAVIDTYWQTETGGHILTPLPGATALKPGSATKPFFGVKPAIVDNEGKILEGACEGNLVILDSWPGQMRTVFGDHARFEKTYFSTFKGMYFTGDGARRDADGDYWITGRVDDVINVSGHRLGTAEIESAINRHAAVAESAVVGFPHDLKGQGIYAYVILKEGTEANDATVTEINKTVRSIIGPIASIDHVQWTTGLPKTRSGKIMRRILRKVAANEVDSLGDTSTLADPAIVDTLVKNRKQ